MDGVEYQSERFDIATPQYAKGLWAVVGALAVGVATYLGLLIGDVNVLWRIVVALCAAGGALFVVHLWFAGRWVLCQWRRARTYPEVLRAKADNDQQLAMLGAAHALAMGVPLLPVSAFYYRKDTLMMVLRIDDQCRISVGDGLLIVDTVEVKALGRARVSDVAQGRANAEFDQRRGDPVFLGFLRQRLKEQQRRVDDVAAIRDKDMDARYRAVRQLQEEGGT